MTRWLTTLAIFPLMAFIFWLGGYDFDTRGFGPAYGFVLTCFCAGVVYSFPGWKKED